METKNIKNRNRGIIIYFPLFLAIVAIGGIFLGRYFRVIDVNGKHIIYPNSENKRGILDFNPKVDKLSGMLNYIEYNYVDKIDRDAITEEVIPVILENLDPHSVYIPASDLDRYQEPLKGNFGGVGVYFNMLNDTLIVVQTIANGPAEKVGIFAGDRIITVDGEVIAGKGFPSDSIVKRLKGPKGTKVNVGIVRKHVKEILHFDITRDDIPLYSVDIAYMLNKETGYIKLNKFSQRTYNEFKEAYLSLQKLGLKKLILDLRNNGGGYMDQAIKLADEFLIGKELIVFTQGKNRKKVEYSSEPGGICVDIALAILIDESSASASEIVAGAIQDNDRGIIIGRRSFGKGLVQEPTKFPDGSELRLTVARYYTPTGRCIQREYSNGVEDYYDEITNRYLHGELQTKDSITFVDSLKYTTPKGKVVYGGGGIMPDVFIPADTSGFTDYLLLIRNKGLLYQFALEYTDKNRKKLNHLNTAGEIVHYLNSKNILSEFTKYARVKGVRPQKGEIESSGKIITTQLYAYIARNIIDNKGYYPIIKDIDNTLQRAIEELN